MNGKRIMPAIPITSGRDHEQLRQLISQLGEGIILVDFDQTILWSNDAALAMHGVKAQGDLGANVDEYRSRFRLTFRNNCLVNLGEHPIERVIIGEKARDVVVGVSPVSRPDMNWVHAVRCVVITDRDETPDYLVLVIEDLSEQYEAMDRFESAFNANPAPALICDVSDLRIVRVNQGFLEMTKCLREDFVGHSIFELGFLGEKEDRSQVIIKLKSSETIIQCEVVLTLPKESKGVIVAGQPIELSDEACMLLTFVDLEPRFRAEAALRQSEERFSKAFKLSPVASAICDADSFEFIEVNRAFLRLTGYVEEDLIGHAPRDLSMWVDPLAQKRVLSELVGKQSGEEQELQVRARDGSVFDCALAGDLIMINDTSCILCVIQDITERKRSETELISAIDTVLSDASWFSRSIVERLAGLRQSAKASPARTEFSTLTDRERDVLGLICEGRTDADMAEKLHLSRYTVRNHLSSLYRKIGVTHRGAAVVWARELGTIDLASARSGHKSKKG